MGRDIPWKCEHGVYVSGGDFMADEPCPECGLLEVVQTERGWRAAGAGLAARAETPSAALAAWQDLRALVTRLLRRA